MRAIDYAVDNGARIINLSLYAKGTPPAVVEQALAYAAAKGVIMVGIAGNEARPEVLYPGKYSTVLAVSAADSTRGLASFSSWGSEVAVAAPGHEVVSLLPGGRSARNSGTSFAAPHVAGTLALILSAHPSLSASEAVAILVGSATPLVPTCGNKRDISGSHQMHRLLRVEQETRTLGGLEEYCADLCNEVLVWCPSNVFTVKPRRSTLCSLWAKSEPLAVTAAQRATLEAWVRAKTSPQRTVLRARICLLAADGLVHSAIAARLSISRPTVIL